MASGVQSSWSTVPAGNATADENINWREGQGPSTVNDSARSLMAIVKRWAKDWQGGLVTGGADTAYTLTTNETITLADGVSVVCRMHATNGATPTLNVDSTGAVAIQGVQGTAIPTGLLLQGSVHRFTYYASSAAWIAQGITAALSASVTAGDGLTGGGSIASNPNFAVGAGTGIVVNANDVAVDKASDANVRAAASNKVITADLIESASALVALSDDTTVAIDWNAGINFSLTIAGNRTIGNPSNGQPGTWRTILMQGNNSSDRSPTFGNQYLGDVPVITDCDETKWYLLAIYCVTASHFVVSAKVAKQ